jgi:synapsin
LIRKLVQGLKKNDDWRNILYGFMHANVPSVNSLYSIFMGQERAVVHGELRKLNKKYKEKFPIIPQNY